MKILMKDGGYIEFDGNWRYVDGLAHIVMHQVADRLRKSKISINNMPIDEWNFIYAHYIKAHAKAVNNVYKEELDKQLKKAS